ncbi:MAG: glycosyltransferase [Candidatus Nanopelagicales bacterium]|nr:glycosyltransferase [Candidatus Nanopelagicales bacterium]
MFPLVSVVIPVFNGMPHLRALTDSILAQTYSNLEIIFSEGGGSDSSAAYLNALTDSRIRIIQQPAGTSAAENWTACTTAATGKYIKLVCQDDLLRETAIADQVTDLEAFPEAAMAVAQRDIVDADGKIVYRNRGCSGLKPGLVAGDLVLKAIYLKGMNVVGEPVSVLFRREDLLKAMPWIGTNPLMLDVSCYHKVAQGRHLVIRKESIGAFRVSASSWSTRLATVQLRQFQLWQQEFALSTQPPPTSLDRLRANTNVRIQTRLRRSAYTLLRMRGSFHHGGTRQT